MPSTTPSDLAQIALALDLPADADAVDMMERIEAMQLVRKAATLDQIRRGLSMLSGATALACAAELCRRLPPAWHHAAVLAMQLVEVNERGRALEVEAIRRDALRGARNGSAV